MVKHKYPVVNISKETFITKHLVNSIHSVKFLNVSPHYYMLIHRI